jgi:hypothetical protein
MREISEAILLGEDLKKGQAVEGREPGNKG